MSSAPPILEYSSPLGDGPPPGARAIVEFHDDGVTFVDSPSGLAPVAGTLLGLAGMILGTTIALVVCFNDAFDRGAVHWSSIGYGIFPLVVEVAAIAGFYLTWQDARSSVRISARSGTLRLTRGRNWASRSKEWPFDQIREVSATTLGVTIKLKTIGTLRITPRRGFDVTALHRRPIIELLWVARMLNRAMGRDDVPQHRSFRLS